MGARTGTSAVGVGRCNHHAIVHGRVGQIKELTDIFLSPVTAQLVFNTCSHGCPLHPRRGSSSPTDPHTGISRESHPSSTVCPHTPAPSTVPTHQIPPIPQESAAIIYTYPVISPTVCTGPFHSSKTVQVWQLYGAKPVFQRCCQLRIRFSSCSFSIATTTVEAPSLHKVDSTDVFD